MKLLWIFNVDMLWWSMKLQETDQGVILDVYVKPKSKLFHLKMEGDELVVSCREAPVKGKANKELLKQLSRLFGRKVELVSGFTSRQKRFLVSDIGAEEVKRILASASNSQQ
jgi:uncharacterized protein (TIGR00251 family)